MSDLERDATLQALFADADQDLAGEDFTAQAMARIETLERRRRVNWITFGLVVLLGLAGVAAWLQQALDLFTQGLTLPLFSFENRWLDLALAPINTLGSLIALILLSFTLGFRKIFA